MVSFHFLLFKPLGRFGVAVATELSSPGQLALDCSRGMRFVPAPLVSCHFHIRKRQERVLGNVKFSDSADLLDRQSAHCLEV
jgi:cyanophycinase-like exopeptidase